MSITRAVGGVLYICYRAVKCGVAGFVADSASAGQPFRLRATESDNAYRGSLWFLQPGEMIAYCKRFGFENELALRGRVYKNTKGHYVYRLLRGDGTTKGFQVRQRPYAGLPDKMEAAEQKTRTFIEDDPSPLTIYTPYADLPNRRVPLVICEDPVSALKFADINCVGVALLGTGINDAGCRQLYQFREREIFVALDPGAEKQAIEVWQKLMGHFHVLNMGVVWLKADPKDTTNDELRKALKAAK